MPSTPSRPEPANLTSPTPVSQRDEDAQVLPPGPPRADRDRHRPRPHCPPPGHRRASRGNLAAAPTPDPTIAFDRIARTLRRTIALARKLTDPAPQRPAELRAERAAEQSGQRRLAPASRSSARSRTPSSAGPTAPRRRRCTPSFASAWTTPTSTTTSTSSPSPTSSPRSAATSASSTSPAPIPGSAARPRTCATSAPAQQGPASPSPAIAQPRNRAPDAPPLCPAPPHQHRPAGTLIRVPGRDASLGVPIKTQGRWYQIDLHKVVRHAIPVFEMFGRTGVSRAVRSARARPIEAATAPSPGA